MSDLENFIEDVESALALEHWRRTRRKYLERELAGALSLAIDLVELGDQPEVLAVARKAKNTLGLLEQWSGSHP